MMKKLFILVILFFISAPSLAQVIDTAWVRRYNGLGNSVDEARAIAVDDSGNVYVTGHSTGSGSNNDYATVKYYSNGDTAWIRRYDGPGNYSDDDEAVDIVVDNSGNVYVTGESEGSGDNDDFVTIKYYPNGDTAWLRRYNGLANDNDGALAIAVDDSGYVNVTGVSVGGGTDGDYATIKYYPNGDTAWVRRYNNALANSSLASIDSSPWIIKADPNSLVIITCPPSPPLPKGMDRSTRPI